MNQSLDHLPPHKREMVRSVAELIRETAAVEMIILFGSYARGDWVEDPAGPYFSDVDVLVIVETEASVKKHDVWQTITDRARRLTGRGSLSLIVHDIADVNQQLERGWYFFSDINKEGVLLFDSERFTLAKERNHTPAERAAFARECFDVLFGKCERLYAGFEFFCSQQSTSEAAFILHQVTEGYYKTACMVFTAYRPKSHNLDDLAKRCAGLDPRFRHIFPRATNEERDRYKLLKAAYIDARYNLKYRITGEQLDALAVHVRELRARTEQACQERIAQLAGRADDSATDGK